MTQFDALTTMSDQVIEICWRVRAHGGEFTCATYSSGSWLEVRVTCDGQDSLVYTQLVENIEGARDIARRWRHIVSEVWHV